MNWGLLHLFGSTYFHEHQGLLLGIFAVIILGFMLLDLGLLHRNPGKISLRSAALQSAFWVALSLAFGLLLYFHYDKDEALNYYTAYITEYALSMDNIFVIILILRYFQIDDKYHHKILFWGILGALVMRGLFIFLGVYLVERLHWILYIFGAFLLYTGIKMLFAKEDGENEVDFDKNSVMKFARRFIRFTSYDQGGKFFYRKRGMLLFTRLFMVVLLIESTDLIFAIDSIPAVFGITQDRVVLYTSNIFAVMGLRAMFFMLSGVMNKFYLLQKGLSLVLIFIGVKMGLGIFHDLAKFAEGRSGAVYEVMYQTLTSTGLDHFHFPAKLSLLVICILLFGSAILSILLPKKETPEMATTLVDEKSTSLTDMHTTEADSDPAAVRL